MAVNELTGIDRDVDRFVVFIPSQPNAINSNAVWPRLDGGPISGGFGNGEKWYKKVEATPPSIDHRYTLNSTFGKVEADPPAAAGYPSGTWQAVYEVVKLPLEDLLAQIETEYQRQVRLQFPETENPSTIIQVGGILIKQQAGAVLTTEEQATLTAFVAVRDKIAQLAERRAELVAAATADEDYDLTVWPNLA